MGVIKNLVHGWGGAKYAPYSGHVDYRVMNAKQFGGTPPSMGSPAAAAMRGFDAQPLLPDPKSGAGTLIDDDSAAGDFVKRNWSAM